MGLRISRLAHVFVAVMVIPSGACLTDLGECDIGAAREVVFRDSGDDVDPRNGEAMYAGQALLVASCGNGEFCHTEHVSDDRRYGVPAGFDFDFGLACTGGPCEANADAIAPLTRSQRTVLDHARDILRTARSGSMPPGRFGADIAGRGPGFRRGSFGPGVISSLRDHTLECATLPPGTCEAGATTITFPNPLLPKVGTHEGDEILRNWLACGAPVVESTGPAGSLASGGDCSLPDELGHAGDCVVRINAVIIPPDANWRSIWDGFIGPLCGQTCHTPADTVSFDKSHLDLSSPETAYAELFRSSADGSECGTFGQILVDPDHPDDSLLLHKLTDADDDVCGDRMPNRTTVIPANVIAPIRAWIAAGALPN